MKIRRVITGETKASKAMFAVDEEVSPLREGGGLFQIWGIDHVPTLPTDGIPNFARTAVPEPGGARVYVMVWPPFYIPKPGRPGDVLGSSHDRVEGQAFGIPDGGKIREWDPVTGMHATDSIDIGFVISGEIVCELDDGVATTLRVGDVYIQNGARHAWRNKTDKPCVMGGVFLGASRENP